MSGFNQEVKANKYELTYMQFLHECNHRNHEEQYEIIVQPNLIINIKTININAQSTILHQTPILEGRCKGRLTVSLRSVNNL